MVLEAQICALMDFLEDHRDLALGHIGRTMEGRSLSRRLWIDIAAILNAVSPDCPSKTALEWRSFYNEFKSKLIKKIKLKKTELVATGGGPPKNIILTPLQERLYDILGRDIGEPLPGVRHNPLTRTITLPVEVEVAGGIRSEPALSFPLFDDYENNLPIAMPVVPDMREDVEIRLEQEPASPSTHQPTRRTNSGKRRRPKLTRSNLEERDIQSNSTLEAAQERLEQIEAKKAEATLVHAHATDRLAAAVERIGDIISLALTPSLSKKRRCRIIMSSDSESDL